MGNFYAEAVASGEKIFSIAPMLDWTNPLGNKGLREAT